MHDKTINIWTACFLLWSRAQPHSKTWDTISAIKFNCRFWWCCTRHSSWEVHPPDYQRNIWFHGVPSHMNCWSCPQCTSLAPHLEQKKLLCPTHCCIVHMHWITRLIDNSRTFFDNAIKHFRKLSSALDDLFHHHRDMICVEAGARAEFLPSLR